MIPAVIHNFIVFPMGHRCRYRASAFRTKMIYAFSHLYAFSDRITGRTLKWTRTGDSGRVAPRIRHVRNLVLAWPLAVFVLVVVGSARHMTGPFDVNYWPVLFSTGLVAAMVLPIRRVPLRVPTAPLTLSKRALGPSAPEWLPDAADDLAPQLI